MHARVIVKNVPVRISNLTSKCPYVLLLKKVKKKKAGNFWGYGVHLKKVFLRVQLTWVGPLSKYSETLFWFTKKYELFNPQARNI